MRESTRIVSERCDLAEPNLSPLSASAYVLAVLISLPTPAHALDGCKVLLCLAAPSWRATPACVPDIKQLSRGSGGRKAQRIREGQSVPKVKVYDKAAPSQRPIVVSTPEVQRSRERAVPGR